MVQKKSADQMAKEVFSGARLAYRAFQAGRLLLGDVTVLAELMIEAGVEECMSEAVAESLWEAYEDTRDFEEAARNITRQRCSVCRCPGHNRRTCKGWMWENVGLGH